MTFVNDERSRTHRALVVITFGALAVMAVQLLTRGAADTGWDRIFSKGVYNAIPLLAGAACVMRPGARRERQGWSLIGAGLVAWGLGDLYFTIAFWSTPDSAIPFPSVSDALYLGFYPPILVGLGLLVRAQLVHFARSMWLDAVIAALTVGAIATSVVLPAVIDATSGSVAVVATNLAYPVGDIALLGIVVGFGALARRRLTSMWLIIAAGLGLFALSDSVYLVRVSNGSYSYGTLLDVGWLAALCTVALASTRRAPTLARDRTEADAYLPAIPVTFAVVNVCLVVWDHFRRLDNTALLLSSLALFGIVLRMVWSLRDNRVMLARSVDEAVTDPLTALHNRRRFEADLADALGTTPQQHHVLLLFDLDGFKAYNDRFGHPSGDALLKRLAISLADVAANAGGRAYRLGGDEFCLLAPLTVEGTGSEEEAILQARAKEALTETGDGFTIGTSCGSVLLPTEAAEPDEAMRLADTRMYMSKSARPSAGKQSIDVLLSALGERDPDLMHHTGNVSDLATAVALGLGLPRDDVERIRLAATLHDIGKIAIPDSILAKDGPLDEAEWQFMQRHTIVGQRITSAAPSLRGVGDIVRSTHERWDGHGYPDGLAGEDIPLGARIVFACDAFDAMTSRRSYQGAMTVAEAFAELRRNAGTQFDAGVVEQLIACAAREHRALDAA